MRRELLPIAAAIAVGVAVLGGQGSELAAQPGAAVAPPGTAQPGVSAAAAPAGAAPAGTADPSATGAASSAGDDVVVARVGSATITAGQLHRRMAKMPPFQLRELGKTPGEIQRAFLDRVLVPELLQSAEAEARGLTKRPELAERLSGMHRASLLAELRREASESAVTDDDVKKYYQANLAKFVAPEKVAIWRILVASEEEAKKLLARLGPAPDPKAWAETAREVSLDKTTSMRGGNLGFVEPSGETSQRGVKVDPALLGAVKTLKDGELAPQPIREGDGWAVVWKRQTMRPVTRSLEVERQGIRQLLGQERVQSAVKSLLDGLRVDRVKEVHTEMVDVLAVDSAGDIARALRPGTLPRSKRAARPQPEPGPNGLR